MKSTCKIDGCDKPVKGHGWCQLHYRRFRETGDPLKVKQVQHHGVSLQERFLAYVQQGPGCWEWTGNRDPRGYGRIGMNGKPILAHRMSWMLFRHDITADQHVCHHCDNPSCVKPEHLFLGDAAMNCADKIAKNRMKYGVSRGTAHGCSKLTEDQVREIRSSTGASRIVAEKYGISGRTVREIRTRQSWRHIK